MADLLNIGMSGLSASQIAINTTGHNITNANVEGYSRQEVHRATQIPQFIGAGFQGSGVITTDISRVNNQFLTNQLRADSSNFSEADTYMNQLSQLNTLLANEEASIGKGIQQFFGALQSASNDPSSLSNRQLVLSSAETLSVRFNSIDQRLQSQRGDANKLVATATDEINRLAAGIAQMNQKIAEATGSGNGASPNDLLDRRDQLILELSELVSVSTFEQDGNFVNVMIGSGQSLVSGATASSLTVEQNKSEPGKLVIRMGEADVTKSLTGGALSGLIRANNEVIDDALKTIGTLALGLTEQMNRQQGLGLDLEGQPGSPLFAPLNDPQLQSMRAIEDSANSSTSTGNIAVSITDTSSMTGDDYVLDFIGPGNNDYALSRSSTGEIVTKGTFGDTPSTISLAEGVDITLSEGQYTPGDRVLIQPSRGGAELFKVTMQRPEELAFAQGIRTDSALGNNGTGGLTAGEVIATADDVPNLLTKMKQPLIIRFTSDTTYDVLDNSDPANPVSMVPPIENKTFVVGNSNPVFSEDPTDPAYRGYQVNLTGIPKSGDEFSVTFNNDGVGDNRNALSMIDLQEKATLNGGTKTFSQSYNNLLQGVGGLTNQAQIDRDAADAVLEQSRSARDAEAGVNLDEEAARLIQLEQNYNASARVITTARQIFDSLLQAVS